MIQTVPHEGEERGETTVLQQCETSISLWCTVYHIGLVSDKNEDIVSGLLFVGHDVQEWFETYKNGGGAACTVLYLVLSSMWSCAVKGRGAMFLLRL